MNGRLKHIIAQNQKIFDFYDIVFISETHLPHDCMPDITDFKKYSDPDIKTKERGGIALYTKKSLSKNVYDINYDNCFITFKLDCIPNVVFIGVYFPPENSLYSDECSFLVA